MSRSIVTAKRAILQQLSRQQLAALTEQLDLEVEDRRYRDSHVASIIGDKRIGLADMFACLTFTELKQLQLALDIEQGGRSKQQVVEVMLDALAPLAPKKKRAQRSKRSTAPASPKREEAPAPPPFARPSLAALSEETSRAMGKAVATVTAEAITPIVAPITQSARALTERMADQVDEILDASEALTREASTLRQGLAQILARVEQLAVDVEWLKAEVSRDRPESTSEPGGEQPAGTSSSPPRPT